MRESIPSFLGRGWRFPPAFVRATSDVVMADGDTDIREALGIILTTWIGERVMVPSFGTDLWRRVFGVLSLTALTEISASVRQSVVLWEPRIDVIEVTAATNADVTGQVDVTIQYVVRETNSRSNYVFPFYLQEGTLAPLAS